MYTLGPVIWFDWLLGNILAQQVFQFLKIKWWKSQWTKYIFTLHSEILFFFRSWPPLGFLFMRFFSRSSKIDLRLRCCLLCRKIEARFFLDCKRLCKSSLILEKMRFVLITRASDFREMNNEKQLEKLKTDEQQNLAHLNQMIDWNRQFEICITKTFDYREV